MFFNIKKLITNITTCITLLFLVGCDDICKQSQVLRSQLSSLSTKLDQAIITDGSNSRDRATHTDQPNIGSENSTLPRECSIFITDAENLSKAENYIDKAISLHFVHKVCLKGHDEPTSCGMPNLSISGNTFICDIWADEKLPGFEHASSLSMWLGKIQNEINQGCQHLTMGETDKAAGHFSSARMETDNAISSTEEVMKSKQCSL